MNERKELSAWLAALRDAAAFSVRRIGLDESTAWSLQQGAIRHESGRFFQVIGARWQSPAGLCVEQPLIDQREVGTLAFLMRRQTGQNQLLVQAKIEPGNVGVIQLAPTCQATASNASRIHGGAPPPFSELFAGGCENALYDLLQSEQGTRFYKKRNRNLLAMTRGEMPPSPSHRWLAVEQLFDMLRIDYLVNTDARSVLVSSPWRELVDRIPFSRYQQGFGAELLASAGSQKVAEVVDIKEQLMELRTQFREPEVVSLTGMKSWQLDEGGVAALSGKPFRLQQIGVEVKGREVPRWDQPIIDSAGEGEVTLVCARDQGILCFLFRASAEIGLYNRVELTPTVVVEPGDDSGRKYSLNGAVIVRAQSRQSEEGGRFYQDINNFRIVDAGSVYPVPPGYFWLSLRQIRQLLDESGWFTNEARSALSLLLPWL